MEDYYPDELPAIFDAWGELHGAKAQEGEPESVDVTEFLSM